MIPYPMIAIKCLPACVDGTLVVADFEKNRWGIYDGS